MGRAQLHMCAYANGDAHSMRQTRLRMHAGTAALLRWLRQRRRILCRERVAMHQPQRRQLPQWRQGRAAAAARTRANVNHARSSATSRARRNQAAAPPAPANIRVRRRPRRFLRAAGYLRIAVGFPAAAPRVYAAVARAAMPWRGALLAATRRIASRDCAPCWGVGRSNWVCGIAAGCVGRGGWVYGTWRLRSGVAS
mmetsp:Transcript_7841/g.23582  ORF Transcript_7841/g.23582 Transcript_7841/m.23582 type:complete len:197 (-) Transcript_7841:3823-4413(-)